jgi:nucleoside phosphorylase
MVTMVDDVSRETFINSSNYITTDESTAESYLSKNIHLENMEYYAVLKVAKFFDIPASGIFIVTNYCNKNAHKDFINNHKEAMFRVTEYIEKRELIK